MKLDRNINGRGKYGLVRNRRLSVIQSPEYASAGPASAEIQSDVTDAIRTLEAHGVLEWGHPGTESEFFVIKLRDKNAADALMSYAASAHLYDHEYARDVERLAMRAADGSPFCKKPD